MPKPKQTREYQIEFKAGEDPEIRTTTIRAESPKDAKARLEAIDEFRTLEIEFVKVKAIAGTRQDPITEEPKEASEEPAPGEQDHSNLVAQIMRQATEFNEIGEEDDGQQEASEEPPEGIRVTTSRPVVKLTPEQWKTLALCAELDENDADNGKRLLNWFGNRILNVLETGWHVWTGTHWDAQAGQHAVERYAHLVISRIKREAALLGVSPEDAVIVAAMQKINEERGGDKKKMTPAEKETVLDGEDILKYLAKAKASRYQFGIRSGDRARTNAMIAQAEPHRTILPDALDNDDLAINCINGTVRFIEIEDPESDPDDPRFIPKVFLHKHNQDDLISKRAEVEYDPAATAPNFMRDLNRFQPDASNREFLQVFLGYSILGLTGEQVYAFFYGDGQNWKSALLQAVARTIGNYYKPMFFTSVTGNNMPSGDKPSPDWARLSGVRLLVIEEVPKNEPIKEELIKLVTSGTPLPVRHLLKGLFDMQTKFSAIMTSNGEPNIKGHDRGIWRRTLIVPFDVKIPQAERRPFEEVMAMYDKERAGILNWLVEGALKYRKFGLDCYVTQRMRDFTESVRGDRDAAGSFIADCVQEAEPIDGKEQHVTTRELYNAFRSYCEANGIEPILNSTAFGRQVKRCEVNGVTMEQRKTKVMGVRRYKNIKLHDVPAGESSTSPYGSL